MRKLILAFALLAAICLVGASVAAAADPGPVQVTGQQAATTQQAGAASSATQTDPSNTNISIRVLSPGNDGAVSQTNAVGSSAQAGNQSTTGQAAGQTQQAGGGIQSSQQTAATGQLAGALSAARQSGASNVNMPIRVLSPGDNGTVTQANTAGSQAAAGNGAGTRQTASQTQPGSGCGCGSGSGIQTSDQSAETGQEAGAASQATQTAPANTSISVRVLSPGNDGATRQANTASSAAAAGNTASTAQTGTQTQTGSGCGCASSPSVQQATQNAGTGQAAGAESAAAQLDPANQASPTRVASDGSGGGVSQANRDSSSAIAGNGASTTQSAAQSDAAGSAIQIAGQQTATRQGAEALSAARQDGASNTASPVRVDSAGGGGAVDQANDVNSSAWSGNAASTTQTGAQTDAGARCGCGGLGIQALGQSADTEQGAWALSAAVQRFAGDRPCGCGASGNEASPVRVTSPGNDGSVRQMNEAGSSATAGNRAGTDQRGSQTEAGGGLQIQALGQEAATLQSALAGSAAGQSGAANSASPVRVHSGGGSGSVDQANTVWSGAAAGNDAATSQTGTQRITGAGCGCASLPIQILGQWAGTGQQAAAAAMAVQLDPANDASPTRVWSTGGGGYLRQTNTAGSGGDAGNRARTGQTGAQTS